MSTRTIIAVEPSGGGETVLIETLTEGPSIRLVGCEGQSPFITSIKHGNFGKLKHKFKGSDDEWASILAHFLLQKQPEYEQTVLLDGVRMVYTLKGDNLVLSFRQDVQGIKVTLGEIVLPRDDDFEFNPFEWAQVAAQAHAQTLQEMAELKARASSEQDTIAKLNAQLEDFIKTKNETETAMLQQFMELLNEKKRKIRDQSRLLAGATVDKSAATAVQASRAGSKSRKAGASRTCKRKASAQAAEPAPKAEPDSDAMDVDQEVNEEQDEDEELAEPATPDRSDDETEGEDEAPAPKGRTKFSETARLTSAVSTSKGEDDKSEGVPPPRSLPFGRRATRGGGVEKLLATADEDDETEDEEL